MTRPAHFSPFGSPSFSVPFSTRIHRFARRFRSRDAAAQALINRAQIESPMEAAALREAFDFEASLAHAGGSSRSAGQIAWSVAFGLGERHGSQRPPVGGFSGLDFLSPSFSAPFRSAIARAALAEGFCAERFLIERPMDWPSAFAAAEGDLFSALFSDRFFRRAKTICGANSLMVAAASGNVEKIQRALALGLSPAQTNRSGLSLAHFAAQSDNPRVFEALLGRMDPHARDASGLDVFLFAASAGRVRSVRFFLAEGRAGSVDDAGRNALDIAASAGFHECVEALLPFFALDRRGADGKTLDERLAESDASPRASHSRGDSRVNHALCAALIEGERIRREMALAAPLGPVAPASVEAAAETSEALAKARQPDSFGRLQADCQGSGEARPARRALRL